MTLTNTLAKVAATVVAASLVIGVAFVAAPRAEAASLTAAQVQSIISLLQSFGADAGTIANVEASLTGGTPSVPSTPSAGGSCTFTRDLTLGATGDDVTCLQKALMAAGFNIPSLASGAAAYGYFGAQTQSAVAAWQAANNVTPSAGYFGSKSRAAWNLGGGTTGGGTGTGTGTGTTPAGTGLTVNAGTPIANALAPQGASRVPFTNFTVTAGLDGDVVMNSVTVQRVGPGQDAAFAGVVLVDTASGEQIGTAKTFNSNHQANVGAPVTIKAGTTRTFQIAGNMASSLASYAGEAPGLSVVGVNTSATVTGSLPITGAFHTTNATLTVGSLTLATSNAFASNSNATKEIGTTGYKTTGFRLTAGSSEDVRLRSIRWNQTGSVSSSDLANVMTYVNGVGYPAVISADGKYYDSNFGAGIVIPKGNQVDVYVQYDIIGSNASGRTVIFDVDRTTDIFGTGEVYGYGISPAIGASAVPSSRGTITVTSGTPFIYSTQVTVSGASVTTIGKANEVPAQNIAINIPNQPLGGYVVDIKGEEMTVASTIFNLNYSSGSASSNLLTNVTLVDENGAVVAGPVDGVNVGGTAQKVTFTDTVTYKTGRHIYTIRGKLPSTVSGNVTITASTTPSSDWTTVKGVSTGNTISLSSHGLFSMNAMTVKAGALIIGPATSPASQTVTPGGSSVLMANFVFDATQSGEDVRFSSVPGRLTFATGAATELTSCQLFDGTTALSTGSNVVNPSGSSPSDNTFTLDNPVTVTKGTVKTLGVRCNISGSATNNGTFAWSPGAAAFITGFTITGADSGTTITPTNSSGTAPTFTIGTGSVVVSTDASNPSYKLASSGSTGVTNTVMKLRSSNEDVNLTKLGLTLTNTASSTASDLMKVSIYDGATKVGEAVFLGGATVATSTLTTPVLLTKNADKALTIKADFANIGTGEPVTFSGHLVAIDFDSAEGTGAQSGSTLYPSGSTSSNGTRVFKSVPTIALDSSVNNTTGLADGRLMRFKVTADSAGPVGITQFAVNVATSTASLTNITIYGFEDSSYSTPISGVSTSGDLQATDDCASGCASNSPNLTIGVTTSGGTATAIQVPAGATRYFEVRASVAGSQTGASVTTKLLGSSSFPSTAATVTANPLLVASGLAATDFVWSPNSTSTSVRLDQDWTNGFGVSGLPAGGLITTRSH